MKTILAFLTFALVSSLALAAEFDSATYCDGMTAQAGGGDKLILQCIKAEKAAKEELAAMEIPEKTTTLCTTVAETLGGSYQAMKACVDKELNPQPEEEMAEGEGEMKEEAAAPGEEKAAMAQAKEMAK